jgi:hypothetical protein
VPERAVCKERGHAEITHSPGLEPPALDALVARDAAALAEMWAGMPGVVLGPGYPEPPPPPAIVGAFSFGKQGWRAGGDAPQQRRRAGPVKQERFIPRNEQRIDPQYSLTNHGEPPTPTAFRRPVGVVLETLPEPPAREVGECVLSTGLLDHLRVLKSERLEVAHAQEAHRA